MPLAQHDARSPKREAAGAISSVQRRSFGFLLGKLAILVLIVGIAGLATLAKDGQYFPISNPARHVSLSTKMNVAYPPVICDHATPREVAPIEEPQSPPPLIVRRTEPRSLPIQSVGLTVSLQHRSPPPPVS
jgi:hypothetical protein